MLFDGGEGRVTLVRNSSLIGIVAALSLLTFDSSNAQQTGPARCPIGPGGSPIDIEDTDPVKTHRLMPEYQVMPLAISNGSEGLTLSVSGDQTLSVGAKRMRLTHVHFSTPSEHTILTQRFPMEIQLTHQMQDGRMAVLSVLVASGSSHPAIEEIWPFLPIERGQSNNRPDIRINARDLLPNDLSYFRYQGTLTRSPCTSGTAWYVLKTPIQMSAEQIAAARSVQGVTAAPLQDRGYRMILDTAQ